MQLASNIVVPLSTSDGRSLPPSESQLQQELLDRSFDLGDDDVLDIQAALGAFTKPFDSTKVVKTANGAAKATDGQEETVRNDIQDNGVDDQDDSDVDEAMEKRIAELQADAFDDEVADEMVDELKEIGMFHFLQKYVVEKQVPLQKLLLLFGIIAPADDDLPDQAHLLRILKIALTRTLRNRFPLEEYTTPQHAVSLIRSACNIVVLTGAGISTNCGIPDFRSSSGIYARLQATGRYPELTDPQEMFDMEVFRDNPEIFYSFAQELYPSDDVGRSSKAHRWIRQLEVQGKLLRNYSQNIDTLEKTAGIQSVLHAHGSFATASCIRCHAQFPGDSIKEAIFSQTVPMCAVCTAVKPSTSTNSKPAKKRKLNNGYTSQSDSDGEDWVNPWHGKPIVKPDITFFGQALDDAFDRCLLADREDVDLLIVMGTSLQVAPVSELLAHIPHRVPQILINRDPVPHVMDRIDIALLGDCDVIVDWLASQLSESQDGTTSEAAVDAQAGDVTDYRQAIDGVDNVWFFAGANEEHRWIDRMREYVNAEDDVDSARDTAGNASEDTEAAYAGLAALVTEVPAAAIDPSANAATLTGGPI